MKKRVFRHRLEERNKAILFRSLNGEKLVTIAADYGITAGRVKQIVDREVRWVDAASINADVKDKYIKRLGNALRP